MLQTSFSNASPYTVHKFSITMIELVCALWLSLRTAAAKLLQSCPTLCDPIDSSQLGSPIPGILQARILEWVAISFSSA